MNNLFNNKKFGIKASPAVVRTERVRSLAKPSALPRQTLSAKAKGDRVDLSRCSPVRCLSSSARSSPAIPDFESHESIPLYKSNKRKTSRVQSPAHTRRVETDSEDDDDDDIEVASLAEIEEHAKRQKVEKPYDKNRKLRLQETMLDDEGSTIDMIHAADITSATKKPSSSSRTVKNITVELKYPTSLSRERYDLVFGRDKINPLQEIIDVASIVTEVYLTDEQAAKFNDPDSGIIRKLEKARNLLSRDVENEVFLQGFKDAVDIYNSTLQHLVKDGALNDKLDYMHDLPLKMVTCILHQVYDRAVSPKVDLVRKYKPASDNIYGELLPPFVSRILNEAGLNSDKTFLDLGSGVGSVVLQAALEFGCDSWGCEMMDNACILADAQQKEFEARCRLWGIKTGAVHLGRGNFLDDQETQRVMRVADVILVNNQAFGMQLNRNLIDSFLDLKDGCKIISLVNFVDRKLSSRTIDDPANLLDVKKGEYHSNSVSWTDGGGNYYIATKDQKRLAAFFKS